MKAQDIYDLREVTGFVSGTDLHDLFIQVAGEPSPSGNVEIDEAKLMEHPVGQQAVELLHSPLEDSLEDIINYTGPPRVS